MRGALADRSPDVRAAVLAEAATLPAGRGGRNLSRSALRDPDPSLRRRAEEATARAGRARAGRGGRRARRTCCRTATRARGGPALALFEPIAARAPAACAPALARVVLGERLPDDARVAALAILRADGSAGGRRCAPLWRRRSSPESSPRLRAAALPLYARLISPAEAEEIARAEMKGLAGRARRRRRRVGALAADRPDAAEKPLKWMLYDPAPEVRIEAARAFGSLAPRRPRAHATRRSNDPSPEVERAAIESALALAPANPDPGRRHARVAR